MLCKASTPKEGMCLAGRHRNLFVWLLCFSLLPKLFGENKGSLFLTVTDCSI